MLPGQGYASLNYRSRLARLHSDSLELRCLKHLIYTYKIICGLVNDTGAYADVSFHACKLCSLHWYAIEVTNMNQGLFPHCNPVDLHKYFFSHIQQSIYRLNLITSLHQSRLVYSFYQKHRLVTICVARVLISVDFNMLTCFVHYRQSVSFHFHVYVLAFSCLLTTNNVREVINKILYESIMAFAYVNGLRGNDVLYITFMILLLTVPSACISFMAIYRISCSTDSFTMCTSTFFKMRLKVKKC